MSSTTSRPQERGQVLVLFAGGLVALLIVAALAFDVGMMLVERRDEQNAADAAALAGARSWAETLRQDAIPQHTAVLLVGEGQPYRAVEVSKVLGLPVVAALADDPDAAAVYSRGAPPPKRFDVGPLTRSLQATMEAIQGQLARGPARLASEVSS